jgi:peptide-methionine (S)-S-oxide reductase
MSASNPPTCVATFAAGCFWGVESAFRQVPGVLDVEVGYTGGTTEHPTYEDVCTGSTKHAEAVRITFDPSVVSYDQLLHVFFDLHDPTQRDGQGLDVGTQYRSAVFYHSDEQRLAAERGIGELTAAGRYAPRTIVTEVTAASPWYRAEEYHQRYHEKHGGLTCG